MSASGGVLRAALVGHGIARSLTPAMHEAEGRAQGLGYRYGMIDTGEAGDLSGIIEQAEADGLVGLNITHPFKQAVLAHLDRLSETAARLGAVNAVVLRNGERVGHNTDHSGFCASFTADLGDAPKGRVLLLGAGGAGAAVGFGLLDCGAEEVLIHDIDATRTKALGNKLRRCCPDKRIATVPALTPGVAECIDGIVNATPMGMVSHPGSAFPPDLLHARHWVMDIVYFPLETAFLAQARALGCRTASGAGMAVHQAADAFRLFTGRRADPDRMAAVFHRLSATL